MREIFKNGKKILTSPQHSVLSAAVIIMSMVVASQVLGVVRQRVLLHYFTPSEYSLFLAAFRLPDLVFEVLMFGTFSSAFIPIFTKALDKGEKYAWDIAARVVTLGLMIFTFVALAFGAFSTTFYQIITPGFDEASITQISQIARMLFAAQGFFIVSYILTGILESMRRFLIPALAPLLYNIGIIVGTIFLTPSLGIMAPAVGVIIGALLHFSIQLPLAFRLGFRFRFRAKPTPEVVAIGKLAAPRLLELSFLQVLKTVELSFATLLSAASYTYLTLASSLQAVPVTLFGISLAKAAFPTLSANSDKPATFQKTFDSAFNQMLFFVVPLATCLIVLRIPIVRLIYGTDIFNWEATVQTGLVLSAYAIGVPFQAVLTLLSRGFYARHNTKTPVTFSIIDVVLTIILQIVFIFVFHLPVWSIALANSLSIIIQVLTLYVILQHQLSRFTLKALLPAIKITVSGIISGFTMFVILKLFDQSVWVKRLSFLTDLDIATQLPFQRFVLDTRYTTNLMVLTIVTGVVGAIVYLTLLAFMRSRELATFISILRTKSFTSPAVDELEPLTSNTSEASA